MDGVKTTLAVGVAMGLWVGSSHADLESACPFEPLRDPFWPVGYVPENWQSDAAVEEGSSPAPVRLDWEAPEALMKVSATSCMGNKSVAIINGELKEEGEVVQMNYNQRCYTWKLRKVNSNGTIQLDRVDIIGLSHEF